MKTKFLFASTVLFSSFLGNPSFALAQGTFQNLNFESADFGPPITGPVMGADYQPIGLALPGWNASIDGVPVTEVLQNGYTTGAPSIDVFGRGWSSIGPGIIGGNYTVFLQASIAPYDVSLWQTGTIPANAQSIQFSAWNWEPSTTIFTVSFDGNTLSPEVLSTGQTAAGQPYTVYGANVASYAGQTGQLEFTSGFNNSGPSWTELDDIAFSTSAVPEPNTLALMLMAVGAYGVRRWRTKVSLKAWKTFACISVFFLLRTV